MAKAEQVLEEEIKLLNKRSDELSHIASDFIEIFKSQITKKMSEKPILSDWVKSKVQQGKYQQHFIKDKKKQKPPTVFGARDLIIKVKEQNPKEFPFQCKVTDYPHEKMLTYAFKDGLIPTPKDIARFYLDFLATKWLDVRKQILEAYENMSDPGKAPFTG